MPKPVRLTPAEWEIMEAVWALGGSPSVRQVLERAFPRGEKAYTTVQTTMNTLERKGFLHRCKVGLVNFYEPTCTRGEMARTETAAIVSEVFGGSIPALTNSLLSLEDVDLDEIARIKELLEKRERELREEEP